MYKITFHLKSLSPYIQNNPIGIIEDVKTASGKTRIGKQEADPLKTGYRNENGYYIPSRQIDGALVRAGMKVKLGKANISNFIKACVFAEGDLIMKRNGKNIKTHDFVYNDPIIRKDGQMVFNPRVAFNEWEGEITYVVTEDSIPKNKIEEVIVNAGAFVGIGARRPRYGRFMVE